MKNSKITGIFSFFCYNINYRERRIAMLSLKKIKKSYQTGEFIQHALKGVSLDFRSNEFVAILGPSGSGKTTLLNIIGGLDRYDSGDLIINHKSTKKFKDQDWDAYRNNCIGFIFQSYNLIGHINVLENVELSMTLSGVSVKERKERALKALERVGLKEHAHKKPNQLSGGQMQRVAIARALVNDPDIILADEPTGALDSETSVQIMNLIKEIAKEKLVIMVTHNEELAQEYASRIIALKDGEIINDSNPIKKEEKQNKNFNIRKTAMSFWMALKLSFNNIKTKKGRTLLTAFASSIGIIGIALILSLSNGFQIQIDEFEASTLSSMPIMINEQAMQLDEETMLKMQQEMTGTDQTEYPTIDAIYPYKNQLEEMLHQNKITQEYIDYIEKIDPSWTAGISYTRATTLNLVTQSSTGYQMINTSSMNFATIPKKLDEAQPGVMEDNYDILIGHLPTSKEELLLVVDSKNRVDNNLLKALGFDVEQESISFADILNKEFKVIFNDELYQSLGSYFTLNQDYEALYQNEHSLTVKISGIARGKEEKKVVTNSSYIAYTEDLVNYVVDQNKNSQVVTVQQEKDYNVLTGQKFSAVDPTDSTAATKENILSYLGANSVPVAINIYPRDFNSKNKITDYLDQYNADKEMENQIIYTDMAATISSLSGNIMDAITIVLIAFSAISLVVSCIMIAIITYISVLERTKEIGVLRALGARKKDVKRVFNAETFIIGVASGLLGILIAWLFTIPVNVLLKNLTDLDHVARLNPIHALILVAISVFLTVLSGSIPARMASKKDPVEALRTE